MINTSRKVRNAKFTVNVTDQAGNKGKETVTYNVN
jgi:hypothetical protein